MPDGVSFAVLDTDAQELFVSVVADEVLLFEPNAEHIPPKDPDAVFSDPMEIFIEAVNLGMFCGATLEPSLSKGSIIKKKVELEKRKQSWMISLQGVDRGVFLILLNMLRARLPTELIIRTERTRKSIFSSSRLDPNTLRYPGIFGPEPLQLKWEEPVSSCDRSVHMVFTTEPDDITIQTVYAGFTVWTHLLLLGAYPDTGMPPRKSGAFPNPVFMYDAYTIDQSFQEAFLCHEDAFNAIINWAHIMHTACPIDVLNIR